jgi:hypothetical protein
MLIRVELVKQRDEEKELIMETKTKDMRLFHKLVRNSSSSVDMFLRLPHLMLITVSELIL